MSDEQISTGRIRILCIDDEARILRALRALFREHDVHVTSEPKLAIHVADFPRQCRGLRHRIDHPQGQKMRKLV